MKIQYKDKIFEADKGKRISELFDIVNRNHQ